MAYSDPSRPAVRRRASKRPRVFYGWYVIGVMMIGGLLGAATTNLFMGIMLKPLSAEFGWSRTAVSGAITAGTLAGGFASPLLGRLADRHGPRVMTAVGALAVAAIYFGLANLAQLWQFYFSVVIGRGIAAGVLGGVVAITAAANWFRVKRGRAVGLVALSVPFGGAVLALIGQFIMEGQGWRAVFFLFGIATLALVVVPSALVLRRQPEDMGLLPDGRTDVVPEASEDSASGAPTEAAVELSWTFEQALRTTALWLIAVAFLIANLGTGAVAFHQVAYFTDIGFAPTVAAFALSVSAFGAAVGNGLWGLLLERLSERFLAIFVMLLSGIAMMILLLVPVLAGILTGAALYGLAARGSSSLMFVILAKYYGRASYGAISGFANPFMAFGVGVGPLIASMIFDVAGSYRLVFVLFAGFYAIAAMLLWLAKKPAAGENPRTPSGSFGGASGALSA